MEEAQRPIRDDEPLMIAWKEFQETDSFKNSLRWAEIPTHRGGAFWNMFMHGWIAAGGKIDA